MTLTFLCTCQDGAGLHAHLAGTNTLNAARAREQSAERSSGRGLAEFIIFNGNGEKL